MKHGFGLCVQSDPRRGAGVAEQGCLLSSYTAMSGIGGSNPPLSAIFLYALKHLKKNYCTDFKTEKDFEIGAIIEISRNTPRRDA